MKYRTVGSVQYITVPNIIDTSNTVTHNLYGLIPYTSYEISVIAINGVSDQDRTNDNKRTATINNMTSEGGTN